MSIPSLKSIFEAITPENIKDIPVVRIGMEIFINVLEKNSEISRKIRSLYDNELRPDDDPKIIRAKEKIKQGLYMYYTSNLYHCLNNLTQSKSIQSSLKKFGYDKSKLFKPADENINTEFISSFRNFTQMVGTENAIDYMYTFARYLETGTLENDLEIQKTGEPFIIHYEGALNRQIFDSITRPLSHPIGWCYTYTTMFTVMLHDYFGIEVKYIFTKLEIVSQDGRSYIVFTDKTSEDVYADFRQRINPSTNYPFTDDEIAKNVQIFIKKVIDYQYWEDGVYVNRLITFDDDTVIYLNGRTGVIYYTTYEDYVLGLKNPKSVFNEHYLITEVTTDIKFLYTDVIEEFEKYFDISRIRDDNHQIADSQYFEDNNANALNVTGSEYQFVPGYDESIDKVTEFDLDEYKHLARLTYSQDYNGTLLIKDDYNNFMIIPCKDKRGADVLDTYSLRGKNYSVYFYDNINPRYYYRASGLNFDQEIKLNVPRVYTYTTSEKYGVRVSGYTPFDNTFIILSDETLRKDYKIVQQGYFNLEFDTTKLLKGKCRVDAYAVINKKKEFKCFIEFDTLNSFDVTPANIGILDYAIFLDKHAKSVPTFGTDNMVGIRSTVDGQIIGKTIKGFYKQDEYLPDVISSLSFDDKDKQLEDYSTDEIINIKNSVLKDKIIKGNIIEGEDYNKDYRTIYECTFINKGYSYKDIPCTDFIVMDSTRYAYDDFDISVIGSDYYLYTDETEYQSLDDYYIVTNDKFFIVTRENAEKDVKLNVIRNNDTISISTDADDVYIKLVNIDGTKCELYYTEDKLSDLRLLTAIKFNKYNGEPIKIGSGYLTYSIIGKAILYVDVNSTFNYTLRKIILD